MVLEAVREGIAALQNGCRGMYAGCSNLGRCYQAGLGARDVQAGLYQAPLPRAAVHERGAPAPSSAALEVEQLEGHDGQRGEEGDVGKQDGNDDACTRRRRERW